MCERKKRIYCNGVYDLCHMGHFNIIKQASEHGSVVIGVHSDKDVISYKRCPIQTTDERVEAIKHVKWVDEVIPNAPLHTTLNFMENHSLDFVVISSEYDTPNDPYYDEPRQANKIIVVERYPQMSTSEIIKRIKTRTDL